MIYHKFLNKKLFALGIFACVFFLSFVISDEAYAGTCTRLQNQNTAVNCLGTPDFAGAGYYYPSVGLSFTIQPYGTSNDNAEGYVTFCLLNSEGNGVPECYTQLYAVTTASSIYYRPSSGTYNLAGSSSDPDNYYSSFAVLYNGGPSQTVNWTVTPATPCPTSGCGGSPPPAPSPVPPTPPGSHSLQVSINGDGWGRVISSPAGIDCDYQGTTNNGLCSTSFVDGTAVTLTPLATSPNQFNGWGGSACGSQGSPCVFNITQGTSVNASFTVAGGGGSTNVDISANPTQVSNGGQSTLTWSSNANTCTASNGWSGGKAVSGSELRTNITNTTTFTITCSGDYGTAQDSVTVVVPSTINNCTPTPVSSVASGGSVADETLGGIDYKVHTFTSSGTFTPAVNTCVESVVVGGGGAGGSNDDGGDWRSGGGGGGGVTLFSDTVTPTNYAVVVGAGATAGQAQGGNSSFRGYTSIGGGRGGHAGLDTNSYPTAGLSGGSGGGGGGGYVSGAAGAGTSGQGFAGGAGGANPGGAATGGGGGGAGGPGGNSGSGTVSGGPGLVTWGGMCSAGGDTPTGNPGSNYGDGGDGIGGAGSGASGYQGVVKIRYQYAPAPTVDITATPTNPSYGGGTTLSWTSENTSSCTASNGWTGSKPVVGSEGMTNIIAPKTYVITCNGVSGGQATDSVTVTPGASAPTVTNVTISSPTIRPDNTTTYTITVTGIDPAGGANIGEEHALINYQGSNAGAHRGYLMWYHNAAYTGWNTYKNKRSCTGGGIAAIYPGYGEGYIFMDNCSTSVSGNTRTTIFTVRFDSSFTTPVINNDISGRVYNLQDQVDGLDNFDINFGINLLVTGDIDANGSDGPINITTGNAANLTWSSQNAGSCIVAPNNWSGTSHPGSGQSTGPLSSDITYTLVCDGTLVDSVSVNVSEPFNYSLSRQNSVVNVTKSSGTEYGANLITRTLSAGTSEAVILSAPSLPTGVTVYTISNNPCTPNATCSSTVALAVAPDAPVGNHNITIMGAPLSKTVSYTLDIDGSPMTVTCSVVGPTTVLLGQNVTWNSSVSGGFGPYLYTWSGTGFPSPAPTASSHTLSYSTVGPKTATVTVTDTDSGLVQTCPASTTVQVNFDPNFREF